MPAPSRRREGGGDARPVGNGYDVGVETRGTRGRGARARGGHERMDVSTIDQVTLANVAQELGVDIFLTWDVWDAVVMIDSYAHVIDMACPDYWTGPLV